MINIEKIDDNYFNKTVEFLRSVPSIESVDDKILKNACIAIEDERIVGCISYEEFSDKGLIRYFVFKKVLDMSYLDRLLNKLKENAKSNKIKEFVCVAESEQIKELFTNLCFNEIDDKRIFIEEESILDTNFKMSSFLNMYLN